MTLNLVRSTLARDSAHEPLYHRNLSTYRHELRPCHHPLHRVASGPVNKVARYRSRSELLPLVSTVAGDLTLGLILPSTPVPRDPTMWIQSPPWLDLGLPSHQSLPGV
jgi:hypothetical protein